MKQRASVLAGISFSILVFGYLLFIGYISLLLTDFVSPAQLARAGAGELFFRVDEFRLRWWNLRDISNNLLLYMPLGFLVAMLLTCLGGRLASHGLHRWWGFVLSFGVEVTQAFIGRFSDATDVLSNGCGYLLGFLIARCSVTRFGLHPASLLGIAPERPANRLATLAGLRFIYIAVVVIITLLPLDFMICASQISARLRAAGGETLQLLLDPLFYFRAGVDWRTLIPAALLFLPLAFLSGLLQQRGRGAGLLVPASHCLLLGLCVETIDLFTRSGRIELIMPLLGFAIGLGVAWLISLSAGQRGAPVELAGRDARRYLPLIAAVLYGLLLLAVALSPYDLDLSLDALRSKLLYRSNLLPFRLHIAARSVGAAIDIAREFLLYVPLGAVLAWILSSTAQQANRPALPLTVAIGCACCACGIELLQLAVVGRYVDITDVVMASLGGLGGALLWPLLAGAGHAVGPVAPDQPVPRDAPSAGPAEAPELRAG